MSFKESVSTRVTTEANLRTLLWTTNSYDSLVRPDDTVNVTIKLYPMSLLDLDIAEGSMTAVGFFLLLNGQTLVWIGHQMQRIRPS